MYSLLNYMEVQVQRKDPTELHRNFFDSESEIAIKKNIFYNVAEDFIEQHAHFGELYL